MPLPLQFYELVLLWTIHEKLATKPGKLFTIKSKIRFPQCILLTTKENSQPTINLGYQSSLRAKRIGVAGVTRTLDYGTPVCNVSISIQEAAYFHGELPIQVPVDSSSKVVTSISNLINMTPETNQSTSPTHTSYEEQIVILTKNLEKAQRDIIKLESRVKFLEKQNKDQAMK